MNNYSIRPVNTLLAQNPHRECFKIGDFIQIEQRLAENLKKKVTPENKYQTLREKNYLKVITGIIAELKVRKKITPAELIKVTDLLIRQNELRCLIKEHESAYSNLFHPRHDKFGGQRARYYDLAFYHPRDIYQRSRCHHRTSVMKKPFVQIEKIKSEIRKWNNPNIEEFKRHLDNVITAADSENYFTPELITCRSLFYMRAEEFQDDILFGNLQIEKCTPEEMVRYRPEVLSIVYNKNNTNKLMVQEAITHALKSNKKRIYFQAGPSMEIAQWFDAYKYYENRILINQKNITKYKKLHQTALKEFDQCRPGDIVTPHVSKWLVVEKSPKALVRYYYSRTFLIPNVLFLLTRRGFRKDLSRDVLNNDYYENNYRIAEAADQREVQITIRDEMKNQLRSHSKLWLAHQLYPQIKYYFKKKNAQKTLDNINRLFDCLVEVDFSANAAEKLAYLEKLFVEPEITNNLQFKGNYEKFPLYQALEEFLVKFDYHRPLLKKFKILQTVPLNQSQNNTKIKFILTTMPLNKSTKRVTMRKSLEPPQLGHYYYMDQKKTFGMFDIMRPWQRIKLYNWYEFTLPKILESLNIAFTAAELKTNRRVRSQGSLMLRAKVWEITSPREELEKRVTTIF